ncbi:MlaE family lipid ABC transporter permease subunit [Blastomonas sp.]|uniref:ABC transporter permease n=1 Tax=Blastomonas sp. TaxID=1909299 RepID=UPI003593CACF
MGAPADFTIETRDDGSAVLRFIGDLNIATIGHLPERLQQTNETIAAIDLADVSHIDTVGAWIVHRLARDEKAKIINAGDIAERLIEAVGRADPGPLEPPPRQSAVIRILDETGKGVIMAGISALGMISFFGSIVRAIGGVIRHPGRFRLAATIRHFELVGASALGIVGLMSFLIGIVIAQQGAVQLRQFGAEVFTVNLVGRLTLRELGVLMTAIMVAGRSGSAFAAQIGTMKLTEEIDAMRTIGVSPIEALVLPRVAAAVLMMPLLGFYAMMMALVGGAFLSWIVLEIPPATFIVRIQEVVPIHDFYVGMIKAPVFGMIIALAGCYQGMQVRGNAEEVGARTTAAVVQAIFMVIVLDAFFAIFFTEIGWG